MSPDRVIGPRRGLQPAIKCHTSQLGGKTGKPAWSFDDRPGPALRAAGAKIGVAFAESFRTIEILKTEPAKGPQV